eukprot:Skav204356  [mRNA]  locus=scaffold866:33961:34464:+ [translate_table: standard]
MLGDFLGLTPKQGERSPSSAIFDFSWSEQLLGSPQVAAPVVAQAKLPRQTKGTCNCCRAASGAVEREASLGDLESSRPSYKVSNVKDVMQHWADVDGDFLGPPSLPQDSDDSQPSDALASPASPANDFAEEILRDIEQFGNADCLTAMWLKKAQSRRRHPDISGHVQ